MRAQLHPVENIFLIRLCLPFARKNHWKIINTRGAESLRALLCRGQFSAENFQI